jgi:hypothetical protein
MNHVVLECGADTVPGPHISAVCHHDVHSAGTKFHQELSAPGEQRLPEFHTHTGRDGKRVLY